MPDQESPALNLGGPYSPAATLYAAERVAEVIRYLNHATMHHEALGDPSEAYRLLRDVILAVQRLPQLLVQDVRWVEAEHAAGRILVTGGEWEGNPGAAVLDLAARRDDAAGKAQALWVALESVAALLCDMAALEPEDNVDLRWQRL